MILESLQNGLKTVHNKTQYKQIIYNQEQFDFNKGFDKCLPLSQMDVINLTYREMLGCG